jgi:hypothetical protein
MDGLLVVVLVVVVQVGMVVVVRFLSFFLVS